MLRLRKTPGLLKKLFTANGTKSRNFNASRVRKIPEVRAKGQLNVPENRMEFADLKNGMRLVCEHRDSSITTVGVVLPAGSMHERPEERGASLFMEHLIFRRTKGQTREEIANDLDETGAKVGALSLRDMFVFYGTVPSYDVDKIVKLLAEVVINGITLEEDMVDERCVIFRELEEMEHDHEKVVMDYLMSMAYQNTELGRSVYPETLVVRDMEVGAVESFRKRLFQPSSMTMISTGGTPFNDIQNLVNEYFIGTREDNSLMEERCTPKNYPCTNHFRYTGSDIRLRDDDEELGHVAVAVEGPGHADCQDHCTLTVAKELVGSWDQTFGGSANNAPFLAHCAFNTDMCHMYKSFNIGWANTGLWGCYFACDRLKLEDMMWMLQNEWMRLCSTITRKEVERAINQCRTREIVKVNDSLDRFFDIGCRLYRRGCYETLNDRLARYEKVTVENLREVANKYIYDQCPVVAAIGPVENLSDYNTIRSYMYRIRH